MQKTIIEYPKHIKEVDNSADKKAEEALIDTKHEELQEKETLEDFRARQRGQKEKIMYLLTNYDRVPVSWLGGQYNARINELNKELSAAGYIIESEYDSEEKEYFKRLRRVENE